MPSGRLPSVRDRPVGSLVTGMPAEVKAITQGWMSLGSARLGHACRQSHEGYGHQSGHHNDTYMWNAKIKAQTQSDGYPHRATYLLWLLLWLYLFAVNENLYSPQTVEMTNNKQK